jgi:hypothetical protein
LQPVVDDYFVFFRSAISSLREANTEQAINDVILSLKKDREKMMTARTLVQAAAQELNRITSDKKCAELYESIVAIFKPLGEDNDDALSTLAKHQSVKPSAGPLVNPIAGIIVRYKTNIQFQSQGRSLAVAEKRDKLVEMINMAIANIENRWVQSAQIYLQLRFEYLRKSRIANTS